MKTLLLILFLPLCVGAQVRVAGEMRKIMQQADFSGSIAIDTMRKDYLYGLGVVEGLKGEIIIVNGKSYVTAVQGGELDNTSNSKISAAMLVYERIKSWYPVAIKKSIQNLQQLELYLDTLAQHGRTPNEPFSFQIKMTKGRVDYHVIDWKDGTEHTPGNHKQFAKTGSVTDSEVIILGFYSSRHQGIFNHHNSKLHLHMISTSEIVGHVDALQLNEFALMISK